MALLRRQLEEAREEGEKAKAQAARALTLAGRPVGGAEGGNEAASARAKDALEVRQPARGVVARGQAVGGPPGILVPEGSG